MGLAGAVALPDGTWVRGRGRSQPLPPGPVPELGLWLGPRRQEATEEWPLLRVDWPDFRTPREPAAAVTAIREAYGRARAGELVEVTCVGGTGRTGTALACMAVLAGCPADQALSWVRTTYRPRAVETPGQRRWILWFASAVN
jgi:protein-tyrosine phosphatase